MRRASFLSSSFFYNMLNIFTRTDYLGSTEYSYTLNFSKPAAPIVAQMYNFLNLGYEGYRRIAIKDLRNARMLSRALEKTYFKVRTCLDRMFGYRLYPGLA